MTATSIMPPPIENVSIDFSTSQCQGVPSYIFPARQTENRRTLLISIAYDRDSLEAQYLPMALSAELRGKSNLRPPLAVLVVQMYKPLWSKEIADIISRDRPASIFVIDIRLVDETRRDSYEESYIFTHGQSLMGFPDISSFSVPLIDLLLSDGTINVELLHSLQRQVNFQVLVVIPPGLEELPIVLSRRESYANALILFLDTFKNLREAFLPRIEEKLLKRGEIAEIKEVLNPRADRHGAEVFYVTVPIIVQQHYQWS